jgi:hypothetical protein
MQKLNIPPDTSFASLPFDKFNELKFALYVLDTGWNYLFVNEHATRNLQVPLGELVGANMWEKFKALASDPSFMRMKNDIEKGSPVNFVTTSPLNGQRLNIVGYALKDCLLFYASQLPNKEELLNELRTALDKHPD